MNAQSVVVVLLVSGCSLYAAWVLMPAVVRRFIAQQLLRLPLGEQWRLPLARTAAASRGCDCSGCDKVVAARPRGEAQPMRFHARARR